MYTSLLTLIEPEEKAIEQNTLLQHLHTHVGYCIPGDICFDSFNQKNCKTLQKNFLHSLFSLTCTRRLTCRIESPHASLRDYRFLAGSKFGGNGRFVRERQVCAGIGIIFFFLLSKQFIQIYGGTTV